MKQHHDACKRIQRFLQDTLDSVLGNIPALLTVAVFAVFATAIITGG